MSRFSGVETLLTSLNEIDTPGNFDDCRVVTPSGVGGNDAAHAAIVIEHTTQRAAKESIVAVRAVTYQRKSIEGYGQVINSAVRLIHPSILSCKPGE
jgi:hypothetical protein